MTSDKYVGVKPLTDELIVRAVGGPIPIVTVRVDLTIELLDGTHEVFGGDFSVDSALPQWKQAILPHVTKSLLLMAKEWKARTGQVCDFVNDDLRDRIVAEFET